MRIGQLAAQTGVTVQTIRFYERRGLLKKTARLASGYRDYSADAVSRIRFIKRSKDLGYTLSEIVSLLDLSRGHTHDTAKARAIVEAKIRTIEDKIRDLQQMRDELVTIGSVCGCGDGQPVCRVLEQLEYSVEQPRERNQLPGQRG
jgi:DNA-binding transcriptional MerR regulator